jgi:hypothetical protein
MCFGTSTAHRTGDCVSEEHSEEYSEEHLDKVHSEVKVKAHLDVMSFRTMLDARMTID